jgi:hypothetical protein
MTDIPTPDHINPCNQIFSIMKYGVNRVTLFGNPTVILKHRVFNQYHSMRRIMYLDKKVNPIIIKRATD